MAEITAAMVKELRETTGAGMLDCKKALSESNGVIEDAVDWLRKKGLAAAAKKSGRIASEGLVGMVVGGTKGAVVEINSETDFVSRNDTFQNFVNNVADVALNVEGDVEELKSASYPGADKSVSEQLTDMIAKIGENMNIRRSAQVKVNKGVVASYMHNAVTPNLGKIAVLVGLESEAPAEKLNELGKHIAMHIAASNPLFLNVADVDTASLDRERDVLVAQAKASGKPENIIEKMVEGRIRKYYEEVVLTEQAYILDPDKKVGKIIEEAKKELGSEVKLNSYVRIALGEGVEKKEEDFAAEVAAQVNK